MLNCMPTVYIIDLELPIDPILYRGFFALYRGFLHYTGDFCRHIFSKTCSISLKMRLVSTLTMGPLWRGGLLITLPIWIFITCTIIAIKYIFDTVLSIRL